jgi:hypothetical protein
MNESETSELVISKDASDIDIKSIQNETRDQEKTLESKTHQRKFQKGKKKRASRSCFIFVIRLVTPRKTAGELSQAVTKIALIPVSEIPEHIIDIIEARGTWIAIGYGFQPTSTDDQIVDFYEHIDPRHIHKDKTFGKPYPTVKKIIDLSLWPRGHPNLS